MRQGGVERLIDLLIEHVPAELARRHGDRRDLCILASRVGYDVARYFGVTLSPLPVMVQAWNGVALEFAARDMAPNDPEYVRRFDEAGGWIVAVDLVDHGRPGRYPGHLILYERQMQIALDLTLGQLSRPAKGIVLPPAAAFRDFDDVDGGRTYRFGDAAVFYRGLRSMHTNFRAAPDWKRRNPYAGNVIRRIKEVGT